jgi:Zinc carboxypeptidase
MAKTLNFRTLAAAATAAAALVSPAAAQAALTPAGVTLAPAKTSVVSIASAQRRSCATRAPLAGRRGVALTRWTAPSDGYATVRLLGTGQANDWDLSLFAPGGRRLVTSAAFNANEVAQTYVGAGQALTIQTCRIAGRRATQPLSVSFVHIGGAALPGHPAKESLVRVTFNGRAGYELLEQLGFDLGHDVTRNAVSVVLHSPAERTRLLRAGFRFTTLVDDLAAQDRRDRAADARYGRSVGKSPTPTGRTDYRIWSDAQAELKKLATDFPGLVRPITFPKKTFQGRDIQGVEIAKNVDAKDDNRPTFLLVAMHHAREWPSVEAAMEFAWYLAKTGRGDKRVEAILSKARVVIVPAINIDGYINSREFPLMFDVGSTQGFVPTFVELLTGRGAYRRKNCGFPFPVGLVPCDLQTGVDPNRNYGQYWGGPGASSDPTSDTYRGPGPWSEVETQSVHEWSQTHDVTTLITLHNVAALVLRPPGLHTQGLAPDEAALKKLGDAMGKATGYTSQYGWQLYDTTGTTEDWNYAAAGTFGYTIEIGPIGGDFHGPYKTGVIDQWTGDGDEKTKGKGLREALLLAAENSFSKVDHSIIAGRAPAGRTLRLHKTFVTETSPVCGMSDMGPINIIDGCSNEGPIQTIDDLLDYTTVVPASGKYSWMVTPSTRPFVAKKGGTEAWTMTCEDGAKKVIETKQVVVRVGQKVTVDLPCGTTLPKVKKKTKAKKKSKKKSKHRRH